MTCASDLGLGFSTGFSSSGGNIHSGWGLSGAFFFRFFCGGFEPCAVAVDLATDAVTLALSGAIVTLWSS